jgi:hypothetical protein
MKNYIGDRNEIIVGRANGIAPDGSAVMVIARTSSTYGNGVLVMRAEDGLNWTSEFLPTTQALAGCGYDGATNTVYVINSVLTNNALTVTKSTDFGATWETNTADLGAPVGSPWVAFTSVWFDSSRGRLVISTDSRINLLVGTKVALQSTDGVTWTALHTNTIANGTFAGVSFAPNAPYPLFMRASASSGTGVSIYKSNINDDTLEEMEDVITLTIPVSAGLTIAYSPLYKIYVAQNGLGPAATTISFSLEPDGAPRQVTVPSTNLNSQVSFLCWSDEDKQFFASCKADSASTDPALYRTFKSKYGNGGWVYDPAPVYNIQNRFGVSMFYDPIRKLTQIYSHGYTAAQRIQVGYLGIAGTLPTPTPTPTSSITPTPSPVNEGGLVWVSRTAAAANTWSSVAWSTKSEIFAAVASSGGSNTRVMTSVDGISWTLPPQPSSSMSLSSVAYSPELDVFAAVGNGVAVRSAGTGSWLNQSTGAPTQSNWTGVTWSPELNTFVAVAQSGATGVRAMLSTDGNTWTAGSTGNIPSSALWQAVAWSPALGLFAAVGTNNGAQNVMTSPDGVNWTLRASGQTGPSDIWKSIIWCEKLGKFVAIGAAAETNMICSLTSSDGINWTINKSPWSYHANQNWYSISWSPDLELFVIVSYHGTRRTATSKDGVTWSNWPDAVADTKQSYSVTWSQRRFMFVAVGESGSVMTGQSQIVPIPTPTPSVTPTQTPTPSVVYDGLFYHASNITNYGA